MYLFIYICNYIYIYNVCPAKMWVMIGFIKCLFFHIKIKLWNCQRWPSRTCTRCGSTAEDWYPLLHLRLQPVCTNSSTIETEQWTITTRHHFRLFWYHRSIPDLGYKWYLKWYKWWNQGSTVGVLHRKIKNRLTCLGEVWRKPWSLHWKKRKSRIFKSSTHITYLSQSEASWSARFAEFPCNSWACDGVARSV